MVGEEKRKTGMKETKITEREIDGQMTAQGRPCEAFAGGWGWEWLPSTPRSQQEQVVRGLRG